jgi:hypothetical protein
MKKRLESELISIAHRILKLKNKSEVDQLYHETQKLYETLSVLKFYNDNFEQLKSVVSSEELDEKIENSLVEKPIEKVQAPEVVAEIPEEKAAEIETPEIAEEELEEKIEEITTEEEAEVVSEEAIEEVETESDDEENEAPVIVGEIDVEDDEEDEIPVVDAKDDLDFEPLFELAAETPDEQPEEKTEPKKQEPKQISFEDLLGQNYSEPVFVKPNDIVTSIPKKVEEEKAEIIVEKEEPKPASLNEKLSTGINVGLNDRIAFVKNLFGDSNEDYNRVISQLNTFDTLQEAQEFIEDMVKPDYNDWKGKEEYEERFMEIVAKKFA